MNKNFDIVIIGSGPGGYVAAIRAAQLGFKVGVIEKENLGGICLNWGCIPTKALLTSASVFNYAKNSKLFGVEIKDPKVDLDTMIKRSRKVSAQLVSGINSLFKKNKIETIYGVAKLKNSNTVSVKSNENKEDITVTAKNIILATGARARIINGINPDGNLILSYREALVAKRIPKNLIVLGSGAIGMEFAYFFNTLGSKVTVIEMQKQIIPSEDKEISDLAYKSFIKQGINFHLDTAVTKVEKFSNNLKVYLLNNGKEFTIEGDTLISAVGIVPNVENLGLENTKITLEKGRPKVNEWLQTTDPSIYAIGDLVKGPWLAHKASHEGIICVEKIAGLSNMHKLNHRLIPGCIYTNPQIASVGLKEEEAKQLGYQIKVGRFPMIASGKAIALGETEGLVKTIFDAKTGELLGAHMFGSEVTEMIQGYTIGMNLETTEKELINTIFPHPTISESMHEAVLAAFGRSINF